MTTRLENVLQYGFAIRKLRIGGLTGGSSQFRFVFVSSLAARKKNWSSGEDGQNVAKENEERKESKEKNHGEKSSDEAETVCDCRKNYTEKGRVVFHKQVAQVERRNWEKYGYTFQDATSGPEY